MKKLSLKTKEGCWRLLAIFLAVILLSSFAARMISSDAGEIKISRVTYDSRGATVDADLYYPAGTSDKDKLPAVLVAHGGGVAKGVVQGIAEELARRGFVVLNVDAYGAGLSEEPLYDDGGQGIESFDSRSTPAGMLDALNFLRTLNFVDQERIGMTGHSMGSRRTAFAAMLDCGYYTLNDIMINVLYEEFGQEFTVEEINLNADTLAEERLNEDQLSHYQTIREEREIDYNTMLKALCLIGSDAEKINLIQTVDVAGHEVQRNCQVNFGIVTGYWDFSYVDFVSRDTTKESWHTGSEDVTRDTWYIIDDNNATSTALGGFMDVSVLDNEQFQEAIDNRTTRVACYNYETHSKNFFSEQTTSDVVKYFEQTLGYNGGELGSSEADPVDSGSIVFIWREIFNFIAMIGMVCMLFPLAGILLKSRTFACCVGGLKPVPEGSFNKKRYWLFNLVTVIITFVVMYLTNNFFAPGMPWFRALPLFPSWWLTVLLLAMLAVGSAALLIVYWVLDRKTVGSVNLSNLNFKMKITSILKTIVIGIILLAAAYGSLMLIEYLFGQDYRLWMAAFTEMKVEYWGMIWKYAILMLPSFLIIGASTNYTVRKDIPEWLDTAITVIVNSLGVWILCLINFLVLKSGGALFSNFTSTYGFLLFVPVTVYITRKMYKVTNNIWAGAIVNSLLLAWCMCSTFGYHCDVFFGQTWISNFFNI